MPNRDVALALARMGFAVFPCKGETGTDDDDAKRPVPGMFWRKLSSTDPAQIGKWWDKWPGSMPALDLAKSKLLVVDLDLPKKAGEGNGIEWFTPVAAGHGFDLEKSPHTVTLRGGWHLFFRQPDGPPLGNARGTLPPKTEANVDVRGNGGYVIAPGASLPDGRTYQARGSLSDAPVAPDWLTAILRGESGKRLDATPVTTPTAAVHLNGAGTGDRFFRAVNDLALANLGRWVPTVFGSAARHHASTGAYRVSSKALGRQLEEDLSLAPTGIIDFGVHDMGDARQGRRTAIDVVMERGGQKDAKTAALWLCERLGRDPVSLGFDAGGDAAFGAAVARNLVEEKDGTIYDQDTGEVVEPQDGEAEPVPDTLVGAPGLVGEIATWIVDSARRPQPLLALGAALTIVGTAIGRAIAGPTLSATHLYVIGLAPTGAGKDHALASIGRILRAGGMSAHLGPPEFISMPAVINFLMRAPLSVCAQDEFGAFLKRINSRRASGFESAISKILRSAWGASFQVMVTPEWAGRRAEQIVAPALSLYGVSTIEEFYGSLEGADQDNGVLNRFLLLTSEGRPNERDPKVDPITVPETIKAAIAALYTGGGVFAAALRNAAQLDRDPFVLGWGPEAKECYAAFGQEIEKRSDAEPVARSFLARTVEMALRVATIVAAGRSSQTVDLDDMIFGRDLSRWSADAMIRGAREHIADTETQATANRIVRMIRAHGGKIGRRELLRAMQHKVKANDLANLLKEMLEAETIITFDRPSTGRGGRPSVYYGLSNG